MFSLNGGFRTFPNQSWKPKQSANPFLFRASEPLYCEKNEELSLVLCQYWIMWNSFNKKYLECKHAERVPFPYRFIGWHSEMEIIECAGDAWSLEIEVYFGEFYKLLWIVQNCRSYLVENKFRCRELYRNTKRDITIVSQFWITKFPFIVER